MIQIKEQIQDLDTYPGSARIWIYQASETIPEDQLQSVNAAIQRFATQWTSHNVALKATGGLLHRRFLILAVNEFHAGVSGCSIDSSVAFVKQLGGLLKVDFMDRLTFAYLDGEAVRTVTKSALSQAFSEGQVDDSTLFFDNLVSTRDDFVSQWLKPLGESWMKRFC